MDYQAFPSSLESEYPGMTMRAYFAAKAMQAIIIANEDRVSASDVAAMAVVYADAMLLALDEQ